LADKSGKTKRFCDIWEAGGELKQLRNQNLRLLRELKEKKAEVEGLRRSMQSQPTNSSLIKHYERKSTEQEAEIKDLKKQLELQESKAKRSIELETRRLWSLVEEGDLKLQQLQRHLEAQRTGASNGIHDSMTILRSENDKLKGQISKGNVRITQELSTTEFSRDRPPYKDLELMQNSLIEENKQLRSRLEAQPKVHSYSFILKALFSIRRDLQQLKTVAKSVKDELEPSLRLLLLSDNTQVEVTEGREELMIMTELDLVRSVITDLRNALTAIVAGAYGHLLLI
jgi:hypothetical protein